MSGNFKIRPKGWPVVTGCVDDAKNFLRWWHDQYSIHSLALLGNPLLLKIRRNVLWIAWREASRFVRSGKTAKEAYPVGQIVPRRNPCDPIISKENQDFREDVLSVNITGLHNQEDILKAIDDALKSTP